MKEFRPRLDAELFQYVEQLRNMEEGQRKAMFNGEAQPIEIVALEREIRKEKAQLRDTKRKYEALLKAYDKLEEAHEASLYIQEPVRFNPIELRTTGTMRQATAVVQYSDWHVGEVVTKGNSGGLNEFNPEIARKRAVMCFQNTLRLVRKERQNIQIDDLVIHLGGDFIGGWIHPELMQTNSMSPIEEAHYATELLYNGLRFLVDYGKFKRIVILCSRGNHGRNSIKMQHANEAATNYETFIYSSLQRMLPEIEFVVPESEIGYFNIYDFTFRFYHGQQVRFGGGVGGLTIPLNKKQAGWDKVVKAHYNLMGHFHTYSMPNNQTSLNGSLKGFDAYAVSIGVGFEKPLQAFQLVDATHGITVREPIFCQ